MQENWRQRYAELAMSTFFIQGHRCIADALFTKGIAHPQAPCNPGALVLQTCMRERAQPSFPSSSLWGERSGMGTKAGCNQGSCPRQAWDLLSKLLDVANAFMRFDLCIQKESLFPSLSWRSTQGNCIWELTYCSLLLL